ncbi:MAG: hypothetical protein AAF752_00775 [Bacteroidota bacterium]
MKRYIPVFATLALFAGLTLSATAGTETDPDSADSARNWDKFSAALVTNIQAGHPGVQASALRHVVYYGDKVDVSDAVFDIVRIYRDNDDENLRMLALAALHKMDNTWANDFIARSIPFEKSDRVKRQSLAVLSAQ